MDLFREFNFNPTPMRQLILHGGRTLKVSNSARVSNHTCHDV